MDAAGELKANQGLHAFQETTETVMKGLAVLSRRTHKKGHINWLKRQRSLRAHVLVIW